MHSFLIDECLSPALVTLAHRRGSLAVHVAHVGLAGVKDRSLMPFIRQGSHTLVTNNRIDFRLLHAAEELHDGLIVIVPNVSRDERLRLFALVMDHLDLSPDLVNRVLEIDADGNIVVETLAAG